jgi:hypothetical protein
MQDATLPHLHELSILSVESAETPQLLYHNFWRYFMTNNAAVKVTQSDSLSIHMDSLKASGEFFSTIPKLFGATGDAADSKSVFTSDSDGLLTCLLLQSQVSPEVQTDLDECKQHLINLTGVASAYVRDQANTQKNPNLVYDTTTWQNVYNNLPMMGPSKYEEQSFSQSCKGVEIATELLATIMAATVSAGAAVEEFGKFIQGLGGSIQLGHKTGTKAYHLAAITIALEEIKVGNNYEILPKLKAYFIDFTEEQSSWSCGCASYNTYDINFSYKVATSVFNYKALNDPKHPEVKAAFDAFIVQHQLDDIQKSVNFFSTTVDTSSSDTIKVKAS